MPEHKKRTLTYRLLITYTAIILVPIVILVVIASQALQRQQLDMIIETANAEMDETISRLESAYESVARIETAIRMRSDLISLLGAPETDWNNYDNIERYIGELDEISRELFLVNQIDNVHIYVLDHKIPERWPIVLHSSRLDGKEYTEPWDYTYTELSLIMNPVNTNDYVARTSPLTHSGRQIAILQTVIALESLLPEIYNLGSEGKQNDYAFYIAENGEVSRILSDSSSETEYDSISEKALEKAVSAALSDGESRGHIRIRNGIDLYEILYYYHQSSSLLFLKVCPTDQITNTYLIYTFGSVLIFALIMGLVFISSYVSTKRGTRNLVKIMDAMREVAKGNFNIEVENIESNAGDVEEARVSLIALTDQLKSAIMEIKDQERVIADTQIRAMQNQINVHFLINTVESIKMQAMMNDDSDVEHSLDILGELFRYSLRWKERFVMLKDELDYISSYIDLMNFRNDFAIEYINDVREDFYTLRVPKMILQPIVENAFKYSFDIQGIDGVVIINSEELSDRVVLNIINTGTEFDETKKAEVIEYLKEETPERSTKSGSIGIKNIQQRLFMFYGADYNIEIGKDEKGRTKISIPIAREGSSYENLGS